MPRSIGSAERSLIATRLLILAPILLHAPANPRAIRSGRLIAGLAWRGFEVDVLTFWGGEGEPPPVEGARVVAIRSAPPWRPYRTAPRRLARRALRYLRSDPDGLAAWVREGVDTIFAEAPEQRPDLVLAVGLPLSALVAGAEISRRLDIPLIADLGDPWKPRGPAERAVAKRTLATAAALITTSDALADSLRPRLRPGTPVLLAPAGGELSQRAPAAEGERPLFAHLGSITHARVAPEPAFDVLGALHRAGRIEFRSHTSEWRRAGRTLDYPHLPLLDHADALALTARASALLVLGNSNREQLPSKAFEVACSESWALCVSELDDDPTVAVLEASGHAVVAGNDRASITAGVEDILERERRGERPVPAAEHTWEARLDSIAELARSLLTP